MFDFKRACPNFHPTIESLKMRVNNPNEYFWKKLLRLIQYIYGTQSCKLVLSTDDLHVIKYYVEGTSAIQADFNSNTGENMNYGRVVIIS